MTLYAKYKTQASHFGRRYVRLAGFRLQVTPCNSTLYSYILSWSFQGKAQGQIAVAKSGCVAVSGIDISWFTRKHIWEGLQEEHNGKEASNSSDLIIGTDFVTCIRDDDS